MKSIHGMTAAEIEEIRVAGSPAARLFLLVSVLGAFAVPYFVDGGVGGVVAAGCAMVAFMCGCFLPDRGDRRVFVRPAGVRAKSSEIPTGLELLEYLSDEYCKNAEAFNRPISIRQTGPGPTYLVVPGTVPQVEITDECFPEGQVVISFEADLLEYIGTLK